ncbi:MAG: arginine N-succinyltransferase [Myxococcota bacterium]|nr:arginine N-succinyltransferase [Myxococcota bacterium]
MSFQFRVRSAKRSDLSAIYQLAERFNTLNLPANQRRLEALIDEHERSLLMNVTEPERGNGPDPLPPQRRLLFVLESTEPEERVCGVSMLIAVHGTRERPAIYFELREHQTYSTVLEQHFRHQMLQLVFDYEGPTELGALVVDPTLRGHPARPGRALSYSRLAFIASTPSWFRPQLVAELLPPFDEAGGSPLWENLGARFTGIDYERADKLSSEHIHFVQALFPHTPIPTALLPESVRAQLGQVGQGSKPAARLLEAAGFRFDGTIDPFDGGPTLRVRREDSPAFKAWRSGPYLGTLRVSAHQNIGYLCRFRRGEAPENLPFVLVIGSYEVRDDGIALDENTARSLMIGPREEVGVLPLPPWGL